MGSYQKQSSKAPSRDLTKSQTNVKDVEDNLNESNDRQTRPDDLLSLTPASSDMSAGPSLAAGSNVASPTGTNVALPIDRLS